MRKFFLTALFLSLATVFAAADTLGLQDGNVDTLRGLFNQDKTKPRLILLLSPT